MDQLQAQAAIVILTSQCQDGACCNQRDINHLDLRTFKVLMIFGVELPTHDRGLRVNES